MDFNDDNKREEHKEKLCMVKFLGDNYNSFLLWVSYGKSLKESI
ncbi:hypothetical protein SD77_3500 [Bacillus badius]|uniref:Uncharacterized protein n=1 Tax=Bacillus badius TaxID=1455 RepID=A0ABR5AP02_BACBA|nr:hypothetical protein SD78_1295 [Bacillus badius]KIL72500.1 hypothetical protein SD77_3500 [Bacillus badius]